MRFSYNRYMSNMVLKFARQLFAVPLTSYVDSCYFKVNTHRIMNV